MHEDYEKDKASEPEPYQNFFLIQKDDCQLLMIEVPISFEQCSMFSFHKHNEYIDCSLAHWVDHHMSVMGEKVWVVIILDCFICCKVHS